MFPKNLLVRFFSPIQKFTRLRHLFPTAHTAAISGFLCCALESLILCPHRSGLECARKELLPQSEKKARESGSGQKRLRTISDSHPGTGKLFYKGPNSILGFADHVVSVVTKLCLKTAMDNI